MPYRVQRQQQHKKNVDDLRKAHLDIVKLLASQKTKFMARRNGLQIWCTQAIECYLQLKATNGRLTQEASECAAESQGFTLKCLVGWLPSVHLGEVVGKGERAASICKREACRSELTPG